MLEDNALKEYTTEGRNIQVSQRQTSEREETWRRNAAVNTTSVTRGSTIDPRKPNILSGTTPEAVADANKSKNNPEETNQVRAEPETPQQNKKVYTKLAVLTNSIEPEIPPEEVTKAVQPSTVLQHVTSSQNSPTAKKVHERATESPAVQEEADEVSTLPPPVLQEQEQPVESAPKVTTTTDKFAMASPYSPCPSRALPTPSGKNFYEEKNKKKYINKESPNWPESSLTSIEKRLDITSLAFRFR